MPTEGGNNLNTTVKEVLDFVKENDIKFIRLAFCDLLGRQKNIAIMAEELPNAFSNGVSFDAHAIKGFKDIVESDLLLFPDPTTLAILPWRPGTGRVARFYCEMKNPDGSPFLDDGRAILRRISQRADKMGYTCKVNAECEFYLFKTDANGMPTSEPLDRGSYLDMAPLDKGENVRREICLTLAEMNVAPEASRHEHGPGQNAVDFKLGDALEAADNLQTLKTVVKAISDKNGLFASFMPKPILGMAGSGLHINLSLNKNGRNAFCTEKKGSESGMSEIANSFIAGILTRVAEMTLFLNPIANSYERLGKFEAPKYISWSNFNRAQLIRIPAGEGEKVRMELRSPDPAVNPYIAYALIIAAGLDGIEQKLTLPAPVNVDLFSADSAITKKLARLPDSLDEAITLAKKSDFVKSVVGATVLAKFADIKSQEADDFHKASDRAEFYNTRYFGVY